jgi:hypothetical protein
MLPQADVLWPSRHDAERLIEQDVTASTIASRPRYEADYLCDVCGHEVCICDDHAFADERAKAALVQVVNPQMPIFSTRGWSASVLVSTTAPMAGPIRQAVGAWQAAVAFVNHLNPVAALWSDRLALSSSVVRESSADNGGEAVRQAPLDVTVPYLGL